MKNTDKQIEEIQDKLLEAAERKQVFTIRKLHAKLKKLQKGDKK